MRSILLILMPIVGSVVAALWPSNRTRPALLPIIGILHSLLTLSLFFDPPNVVLEDWLGFDALARAVLPVVSLLYLICSFYGFTYLLGFKRGIWASFGSLPKLSHSLLAR